MTTRLLAQAGMGSLVFRDFAFVFQRQADIVQAMDQTVASKRLDVKRGHEAVPIADEALFEIDGQFELSLGGMSLEELFDLLFRELDWQRSILEAVVVKDIGKGRSDDRAETKIGDCPNRMLA